MSTNTVVARAAARASGAAGPTTSATARSAAHAALALGLASAAVSAAWALGVTAGLDTLGGTLERLARERAPLTVVLLAATAGVKVVAAALPVWALRAGGDAVYPSARRRVARALAWATGVVLTTYGGVMAAGTALVLAGGVGAAPDADRYALGWHAALWDPWFALWGLATLVALTASRGRE